MRGADNGHEESIFFSVCSHVGPIDARSRGDNGAALFLSEQIPCSAVAGVVYYLVQRACGRSRSAIKPNEKHGGGGLCLGDCSPVWLRKRSLFIADAS